jgi:hypothetical protein
VKHTGLLLLQSQFRPVSLHAIPQRHPQICLLLRWHRLPSLLDIGQRRVRDGVRGSLLDLRARSWSGDREPGGSGEGLAEHGDSE